MKGGDPFEPPTSLTANRSRLTQNHREAARNYEHEIVTPPFEARIGGPGRGDGDVLIGERARDGRRREQLERGLLPRVRAGVHIQLRAGRNHLFIAAPVEKFVIFKPPLQRSYLV